MSEEHDEEIIEVDADDIGPVTAMQWLGVGVLLAKNCAGAAYYTLKYLDALVDRYVLVEEKERVTRIAMQRDIESITSGVIDG